MRLRTTWSVIMCTFVIACSLGIQAKANTLAISYSFAGAPTGPPIVAGMTLTLDGVATGTVISGNASLNAIWNPVTLKTHNVIDLTNGLNNGTFSMTFADGNTVSGKLFEDDSQVLTTNTGPFTQMLTFTGGTGEFVNASGSVSGAGVIGTNGFTVSGSGTLNAPAIPEPASAPLLLGGLAALLVALRQAKVQTLR